MAAIYIVNTYDSKGRPFEDEGAAFDATELGDTEALRQAEEEFAWYTERGTNVKLLRVS